MSYQVLYRTYRPSKFSEVVGQEYIVKTLKNAIKKNKIAHAYLFAGPRGTGKTTIAKLFAKAINCENFNEEACDNCKSCNGFNSGNQPDIIELDAASNNGVDDVREIIEQVPYTPIMGKYKVYIIDEVHMLTTSAFNALLKTLEEPPAHVIFILATTDPQKIIPTVLSRCQRYNFSKISNFNMKKKMMEVLELEGIEYEEKALDEIAVLAEGGMRDALSILEQVLSYNSEGVFLDDVQQIFGLSSTEEKAKLLINVHKNQIGEVITSLRDMYQSGVDPKRLAIDMLEIVKEALIYSDGAEEDLLKKLPKIQAIDILNECSPKQLLNDIKCLEDLICNSSANNNFLSYLELCFIKMAGTISSNEVVTRETIVEVKPEIKKEKPIIKKPAPKVEPKQTVEEAKKEEPKTEDVKPEVEKVQEIPEEPKPEEVKEEIKVEEPKEVESVKEEPPVEKEIETIPEEKITQENIEPKKETNKDEYLSYLASLLLTATKDEKINDSIIYNKLELYKFEADKRKFYELLHGSELFASGKEAIIVVGDKTQINNINADEVKDDLYKFLVEDFGIDKVMFGIEKDDRAKLVELYRAMIKDKSSKPGVVNKPKIVRERTNEEKLKELFDQVRVEE